MSRKLALLIALSPALWLSTAAALGLGEIEVTSRLNQRFSATIPLTSLSPEEADGLRVSLASNADFARAGLDRSEYLGTLTFNVVSEGNPRIEVTSAQIAREPFVAFLVDVRSRNGRLLREYTVLLDPPGLPEPAPNVARTTPPPAEPAPAPQTSRSEFFETADEASRTPPTPTPPVAEAEPATPADAGTTPAPDAAPVAAMSADSYGPVQAGETFWSIATKLRPDPRITMDQMLLALYDANPGAFEGGINGLKRGATLKVPPVESITAVGAASAKARVSELRGLPAPAPRAPVERPAAPPATSVFTPEPAPAVVQAPPKPAPPEAEKKTEPLRPAEPPPQATPPPAQVTPAPAPAQPVTPPAEPAASTPTPDPAATPAAPADGQPLEPVDTAAPTDPAAGETTEPAPVEPSPAPVLPEPAGDDVGGLLAKLAPYVLVALLLGAFAYGASRYMRNRAAKPAAPPPQISPKVAAALAATSPGRKLPPAAAAPPPPPPAPAKPSLGDRLKALFQRDKSASAAAPAKAAAAAAVAAKAVPPPPPKPSAREQLERLDNTIADDVPPPPTREMPAPRAPQPAPSLQSTQVAAPVIPAAAQLPPLPSEPQTYETQQLPTFDATEIMEVEAARTAVEAGNVDFDVTQQFATETVQINLDTNDPISEADFHLAYGLYDEAALLLKQAADKNPERSELRVKLAETYFAAGKPVEFTQVAESLRNELPPAEWAKLAILGQQLSPDSPLFKDAGGAPLATDLDMVFDDATPASRPIPTPPSKPVAPAAAGGGLEFKLEELELPSMDLPAAGAAPAGGKGDALEFDLGDFDLNKAEDDLSATAQPGARGNAVEFDPGSLAAPVADKAPAGDAGMRLDDFDIGEMPPESDGISAGDEAGTKLDLARAYVDMGDNDMARNLLNEVLQQGTDAQKKEASGLLGRLG